ncbi:hypothetical protein [Streptomyces corynorhini]|uniref:Uncharacterized protein n=1 Tax=Streptomyces corynorhini TaxID=2282652 RepID=A0A370B3K4_9ACTN|nr:hypothetical protein [Streptomyces corynorhini]RDG36437.1 hypothetical protein DVH02_20110 [Streptomyces corynorhini]
MPVDLFAALSAMIRAEAARADESASRLRAVGSGGSGGPRGRGAEAGPVAEPVAATAAATSSVVTSAAASGTAEPERAERPGREDLR